MRGAASLAGFCHATVSHPACMQVPPGFEEAVCSLAKSERAIVSCPASKAQSSAPGRPCLLPPPPEHVDRVEFELELLSMLQACSAPLHLPSACSLAGQGYACKVGAAALRMKDMRSWHLQGLPPVLLTS